MRFSDLMGSGGEREPRQSDSAIDAAIAPYLGDATPEPSTPIDTVVEPVEVVAAGEPWAPPAPDLPAQPTPPAPVAAVEVANPIDPEPEPVPRSWQPDHPVVTPAAPVTSAEVSASATAVAVADFTPLSDDLLPRRR